MSVSALRRPSRRSADRTAAAKAVMLGFVEPCDPTLQERAPTGGEWVYEIKTDGYRAQVHVRNGRVTITPAAAMIGRSSSRALPKPHPSSRFVRPLSMAKRLSLATQASQ